MASIQPARYTPVSFAADMLPRVRRDHEQLIHGDAAFQAILDTEVAVPDALSPSPLPAVDTAALDAYVARYTDFFGLGALAGTRVALYEHSSVARDVLRTVFEHLGAEVLSLGRTDTFVPIDTEAVRAEDIAQAHAWAQAHRFDAIVSTDGDADRPLIGDETGTWLRGDVVGILCAQYLQADVVVTPVSSNTAVELCGSFRQIVRTRIGSPSPRSVHNCLPRRCVLWAMIALAASRMLPQER